MFLFYKCLNGCFSFFKDPASDQLIDPPAETEPLMNIPRLDIDMDWSDEKFLEYQAEAREYLRQNKGKTQWSWPQGLGVVGGGPAVRVWSMVISAPFFPHMFLF